jgi:hypothetical protein
MRNLSISSVIGLANTRLKFRVFDWDGSSVGRMIWVADDGDERDIRAIGNTTFGDDVAVSVTFDSQTYELGNAVTVNI